MHPTIRRPRFALLYASALSWPLAFLTADAVVAQPAAPSKAPIVAVMKIEKRGADLGWEVLSRLNVFFEERLAGCGSFRLVPREQVRAQLAQMRVESYRDCYDQSCQIELGKALSADLILRPTIVRIAERCEVSATFWDLLTEASVKSANAQADCTEAGIGEALVAIVGQLCGVAPPPADSRPAPLQTGKPSERPEVPTGTMLYLRIDPPDATLRLDGEVLATRSLRRHEDGWLVPVRRGKHVLEASHPQRRKQVEEFYVDQGRIHELDVRLSKPLPPPPPCGTGQCVGDLTIRSRPAEASVYLDGVDTGKSTEATATDPTLGSILLSDLPVGPHRIEVRKPTYDPAATEVQVVRNKMVGTDVLVLESRLGRLAIQSTPSGAQVLLDGVPVGTTPWRNDRIEAGPYRVELQAPDHRPRLELVTVPRKNTLKLDWRLVPAYGSILVTARENGRPVEGAEVRLDGRDVGVRTDARGIGLLEKVPSGMRRVRLSHRLYRSGDMQVEVADDQVVERSHALEPAYGYLAVSASSETDAMVLLDGDFLGPAPLEATRIPAGNHEIQVKPRDEEKYRGMEERFALEVGEKRSFNAKVTPRTGTLRVESSPPGATVTLDWETLGTTPGRWDQLQGTYRLEVSAPGYRTETRQVRVVEGRPTHEQVELKAPDSRPAATPATSAPERRDSGRSMPTPEFPKLRPESRSSERSPYSGWAWDRSEPVRFSAYLGILGGSILLDGPDRWAVSVIPLNIGVLLGGRWRLGANLDMNLLFNSEAPEETADKDGGDLRLVAAAGIAVGVQLFELEDAFTMSLDVPLAFEFNGSRCEEWDMSVEKDRTCTGSRKVPNSFVWGGRLLMKIKRWFVIGLKVDHSLENGVSAGAFLGLGY